MNNKLPEKLTLLRKYFQYAQGDIAAKLNIPVTEYMQWENGNSICSITQLKQLADLYHVSLDELADNTKSVRMPDDTLGNSVNIPFMNGADINATQVVGSQPTAAFSSVTEDNGHTKVMEKVQEPQRKFYEDEDEDEEEPVKEKKNTGKSGDAGKRKKQSIIIIAVVAVVIVAVAALIILLNGGGTSLSVSDVNRLAAGDTYTLYVEKSGSVKIYGTYTGTSFSNAVQVSAYEDHAAALTSGGTVITSDDNEDAAAWKDIRYIAAGKYHTAGVTSEGKVVCAGSEDACKVSTWTNISSVYAGNEITIGLSNDGTVSASGTNSSVVSGLTNVRYVSLSDSFITVTKKDGTVTNYPISSNSVLDTSSWTDVVSTVTGSDMTAGLCKDGSVKIACSDEDIQLAVEKWKNIKYMTAHGTTIIGIDKSGNMYGAGDNTYNQYVNTSTDTKETEDTSKQLDEPSNIQVTETTANIVIKWNTVENADYYEVTMDSSPETTAKTSSNSTSVATTNLVDGQSYTISVTAKSNNDKYEEATGTTVYTYVAKTVQLSTPGSVTAIAGSNTWTVSWAEVDHADYYMISLNGGDSVRANTNSYTYSLSDTLLFEGIQEVSITACSLNSTYSESEAGTAQVQYTPATFRVTITFSDGTNNISTQVVQAVSGYYSYEELTNGLVPEGYVLSSSGSVSITSDYGLTVYVTNTQGETNE